jgi:uncharacterized protein YraI
MIGARLMTCVTVLALSAAGAEAEPAYVNSTVNLRASPSTTSGIVSKIPAGTRVEATHCSDWCRIEWQGQGGYVIASALDRGRSRPAAAAVAEDNPVPMSLPKVDETPQRYQGPFFAGTGPGRGFGWLGYRGRW